MEYCQAGRAGPKVTSEPPIFYIWFWVRRVEVLNDPLTSISPLNVRPALAAISFGLSRKFMMGADSASVRPRGSPGVEHKTARSAAPLKGLIMSHEYDDPVTKEAIEAAVALTVELRSGGRVAPIDDLATEAVDTVFCSCVTGAADASANGRAPTHAGLIAEVARLAQVRVLVPSPDDQR